MPDPSPSNADSLNLQLPTARKKDYIIIIIIIIIRIVFSCIQLLFTCQKVNPFAQVALHTDVYIQSHHYLFDDVTCYF